MKFDGPVALFELLTLLGCALHSSIVITIQELHFECNGMKWVLEAVQILEKLLIGEIKCHFWRLHIHRKLGHAKQMLLLLTHCPKFKSGGTESEAKIFQEQI